MGSLDAPRPLIADAIAQHGHWQAAKPALLCGERRLSWRDFDRSTNQVAQGLRALGLAPGSRIAVLMSNGVEMVELLFGAGKAAVTVVPLNTSVSDAAVAAMIADSDALAVAASGEHCRRIDALLAAGAAACDAAEARRRCAARRLDRLHRLARRRARRAVGAWPGRGHRVQHHLQLRHHRACPRASSTATAAGCTGRRTSPLRSVTTAARSRSARSGSTRTSAGWRCSPRSWWAARWSSCPRSAPQGVLTQVARHRVTHGAFVPVQFQRLLELPAPDPASVASLQTIMCCGSPLARGAEACDARPARLRADRALRPHGRHHYHACAGGLRPQDRVGRQAHPRSAAQARRGGRSRGGPRRMR